MTKVLELQLSISPVNEYSGLISFRIDWFDLLAVQGTLKSLLQHYSLKASILRRSAFFTVQLSYPYIITEKAIALPIQTLVNKIMSLFFNMLSRLVITFLQRIKHLLISWLQSPQLYILYSCLSNFTLGDFKFLQFLAVFIHLDICSKNSIQF